MSLKARNSAHRQQIEAGTNGRKRGHKFEELLTKAINECDISKIDFTATATGHLYRGNPAVLLLSYIARNYGIEIIKVQINSGIKSSVSIFIKGGSFDM